MKKVLKKLLRILCAVVAFILVSELLRYLIVDDVDSHTRVQLHEFYAAQENIDAAYVGSSRVKRSFDPTIIDGFTGTSSFNLGSNSQGLDDSLAMIRELCHYHHPRTVYLELYYGMAFKDYDHKSGMTQTFIVLDYLRPSLRKLSYLFNAVPKEHYFNAFILARREWEHLFHPDFIVDLVRRKQSPLYKSYQWDPESAMEDHYGGRGFFGYDSNFYTANLWSSKASGPIEEVNIDEQPSTYRLLRQINDFCKRQGVELVFVVAPQPEWVLVGKGNYQAYIDMLRGVADAFGVRYYDFNLVRPEYFDTNDLSLFRDQGHMNTTGAQCFSELFGRFVSGELSADDIFYGSMAEKLAAEPPTVSGLAESHEDETTGEREGYIISNRDEGLEYQIVAQPKKGEAWVVKPYSPDPHFVLRGGEHGVLSILWREAGKPETEQSIESKY